MPSDGEQALRSGSLTKALPLRLKLSRRPFWFKVQMVWLVLVGLLFFGFYRLGLDFDLIRQKLNGFTFGVL